MTEARNSIPQTTSRSAHPLLGASLSNLIRLFSRYGGPSGAHLRETALLFLSAFGRLPFALGDVIMTAPGKQAIRPPVFILGHWRSGTTHLYNLMSRAGRFASVSPFATALPYDYLTLSRLFRPLLVKSLPGGRFIDQVEVGPDSPQEDEFAIANMSALSFLHALYFPRDFPDTFRKGVFFDGASAADLKRWKRAVAKFYAKLQAERPGATLLIKNPAYTARIPLVREMWPDARFIHIHRNPYKVFFSMRNFYCQLFTALSLQEARVPDLDAHIFESYARMMNRLLRDSEGIPEGQFAEVPFADLQEAPLKVLQKIYRELKFGDFETDKPAFTAYLDSVKRYKKNIYRFPNRQMEEIELHWGKFIKRWGYERPGQG